MLLSRRVVLAVLVSLACASLVLAAEADPAPVRPLPRPPSVAVAQPAGYVYPRAPTTGWWSEAQRRPLNGDVWKVPASTPWKIVLHTTEGGSWSGAFSAYEGRKHPHFTVTYERNRFEAYQHVSIDQSSMALRHPANTPETNMAHTIQIEIVGRAEDAPRFPAGYYAGLKRIIDWIRQQKNIPNVRAEFVGKPASKGTAIKFGAEEFVAFGGVCGHQHVPNNDHSDPGLLNMNLIMPGATVRYPRGPTCNAPGGRVGECKPRAACQGLVVANLCRGTVPVCCVPLRVGSAAPGSTADSSNANAVADTSAPAATVPEVAGADGAANAANANAAAAAPAAPASAPNVTTPAEDSSIAITADELSPEDAQSIAAPGFVGSALRGAAPTRYTYSQSTGTFTFADGSTSSCYSGRVAGTINNPARQNIQSPCQGPSPACMTSPAGPIPQGTYTLSAPGPVNFGAFSWRLTPAATNNMFNRSSFLIHAASATKDAGGQRRSSAGCIIMNLAGRTKLRRGATLVVIA